MGEKRELSPRLFDADAGLARVGRNATERPRQSSLSGGAECALTYSDVGARGEKRELLPHETFPPRSLARQEAAVGGERRSGDE